jgi:TonB family protein
MKATVLIFVSLVFCIAGRANAACSSDLKAHVALGMSFLREAKAYEARSENELAAAEWENLGHQVELIGGATSPEILSCDDETLNRQFYLIASWDEFKQIMAATQDNPQVPPESARLLRQLVSILYTFGGATYYRGDYLTLKSYVREVDDLASIPYCSPEESDTRCKASESRCPVTAKAPSFKAGVVPTVTPEFKAEFSDEYGSSSDYAVEVTVSLDSAGAVESAVVSDSSGVGALDNTVLLAAKASTYRPGIAACKPSPSTFVYRAWYLSDVGTFSLLHP